VLALILWLSEEIQTMAYFSVVGLSARLLVLVLAKACIYHAASSMNHLAVRLSLFRCSSQSNQTQGKSEKPPCESLRSGRSWDRTQTGWVKGEHYSSLE
jgi:hypothetical protein